MALQVHLDHMINHHWDEKQQRDWKLPSWKCDAPAADSANLTVDEMRAQFSKLEKKHGTRLDYPLMMKYCPKTCVLYWEDGDHPYHERVEQDMSRRVSPRDFLTFFDGK